MAFNKFVFAVTLFQCGRLTIGGIEYLPPIVTPGAADEPPPPTRLRGTVDAQDELRFVEISPGPGPTRRLRGGLSKATRWADDGATCALEDFEVWRREEGFWYGEYAFSGADGDPYAEANWNYGYGHYAGFIHLELDGNKLRQRSVFVYPPQDAELCEEDASVVGEGICGRNGNEDVFSVDHAASDCNGNLAANIEMGEMSVETTSKIIGADTVVYTVQLPDRPGAVHGYFGAGFHQRQLTTLPGNDVRVRTVQRFFSDGTPSYASFYRETKLDKAEWVAKLKEYRAAYNVRAEDECAWRMGGGTIVESGVNCEEHFGFAV